MAAGPPMRPTGVWARTSAIGVPVQPALVSWPFQVGLSGIQISGSSALGSLSSGDDVLHGARGDLDVDARLVGVDVLDRLLDQVLHDRGGGQRDDLGDAVGTLGLAAGTAHREEADQAHDEREREAAQDEGLGGAAGATGTVRGSRTRSRAQSSRRDSWRSSHRGVDRRSGRD